MKKESLTLKIFILIFLNDAFDSIAQLCMKKGLSRGGIDSVALSNIMEFVSRNIASPMLWLGLSLYLVNFVLWVVVLYKVDLSIAMPIGSAAYIFVPVMAIIFLGENISPLRWLGILFIVAGIYFTSQSVRHQEGPGDS